VHRDGLAVDAATIRETGAVTVALRRHVLHLLPTMPSRTPMRNIQQLRLCSWSLFQVAWALALAQCAFRWLTGQAVAGVDGGMPLPARSLPLRLTPAPETGHRRAAPGQAGHFP